MANGAKEMRKHRSRRPGDEYKFSDGDFLNLDSGLQELREGIASFHSEYDDLDLSPDSIVVGPGSKQLIFLVLQVFEGGKDGDKKGALGVGWGQGSSPVALTPGECASVFRDDRTRGKGRI